MSKPSPCPSNRDTLVQHPKEYHAYRWIVMWLLPVEIVLHDVGTTVPGEFVGAHKVKNRN